MGKRLAEKKYFYHVGLHKIIPQIAILIAAIVFCYRADSLNNVWAFWLTQKLGPYILMARIQYDRCATWLSCTLLPCYLTILPSCCLDETDTVWQVCRQCGLNDVLFVPDKNILQS